MPLSSDTIKNLESVKKSGKPCRFVLVSKGAAVISVVAYRKGSEDARVREAKADGNGAVSCGIVDGQGVNLSFKLLRADGYETAPVKPLALKDFLNTGTDLKAKPAIEIVDVLPDVEMEGDEPTSNYRTGEEWKAVLSAIQQATEDQLRATLLIQAIRDCKAESDRVKLDLQTNPNSTTAQSQEETLSRVAEVLKRLGTAPRGPQMPPLPQRPMPPLPPTPNRPPQRPTTPPPLTPAQQQAAQERADRESMKNAVAAKVGAIGGQLKSIYVTAERQKILTECETDSDSDFGKMLSEFDLGGFKTYDQVLGGYENAKTLAAKYLKSHGDPLVGKLPTRVQKRKDHCQKIIADVNTQLETMRLQNQAVVDLCKTYQGLVNKNTPVPFEVTSELKKLVANRLLPDQTKQMLKDTIALILAENRKSANVALQQIQTPTDAQKAEILLRHGCFKGADGGTSGVKLLTESSGQIAFAYKPVNEESQMGLDFLGQEPGAGAMREAISSVLCQEIFTQTKLDLGFPKSDIVRLDGQSGALIEGIKGKMADPEELANKDSAIRRTKPGTPEYTKLTQDRDELLRNIQTIPTQVTPESMQDVVLSSMLTCQWDCKWGNMIVDGNRARPIDGGTAIPTPDVVKRFRDSSSLHGAMTPCLSNLTKYPDYDGDPPNPHRGQTLPQALQPMDATKVAALLQIDSDQLVAAAKAKRDQLVRDNPELKTTMMDNSCFDILKASIRSVQGILKAQPQITLEQFALAYEQWFATWGDQYAQSL